MAARDALRPGRPGASSYAALADSDDDAEEDSESGGDEATSPAIQHDGESSGSITGDEDADEDEDGDAAALAAQSGPRRRLEGSDLALYREERGIKVGFHSPSDSRFGAEDFLESRYPILEFEDLGHFGVPHDLVAACRRCAGGSLFSTSVQSEIWGMLLGSEAVATPSASSAAAAPASLNAVDIPVCAAWPPMGAAAVDASSEKERFSSVNDAVRRQMWIASSANLKSCSPGTELTRQDPNALFCMHILCMLPREKQHCLNGRRKAPVQDGWPKENGSVVTWGEAYDGGDSSASLLTEGVVKVCGSDGAFAAIKANGSVVTWGMPGLGGDSSAVAALLTEGVVYVCGSASAFAAIRENGSVVTWGDADNGGSSSEVVQLLTEGVVQVYGNHGAFAAIKANGSVVTWGETSEGGNSAAVAPLLTDGVVQVYGSHSAFAAIKANGSVVTWGDAYFGGDSSAVATLLTEGVVQVCGSQGAFAAIKANGSVVTWGGVNVSLDNGGNSAAVAPLLTEGVVQVCGNSDGFAAINADGSVVWWGVAHGVPAAEAELQSEGVVQVYGNLGAFAAIKANGRVEGPLSWETAFDSLPKPVRSEVKFLDFIGATVIGCAPGTISSVYFASVARAALADGGSSMEQPWYFYAAGVLLTAVLLKLVSDVAQKAVDEAIAAKAASLDFDRLCQYTFLLQTDLAKLRQLEAFVFDPLITWRLLPTHAHAQRAPMLPIDCRGFVARASDTGQGQHAHPAPHKHGAFQSTMDEHFHEMEWQGMSPLQTVGVVQPPEIKRTVSRLLAEGFEATAVVDTGELRAAASGAEPGAVNGGAAPEASTNGGGGDAPEARTRLHAHFAYGEEGAEPPAGAEDPHLASVSGRQARQRDLRQQLGPEGVLADPMLLSSTARSVTGRVYAKLTGMDFRRGEALDVEAQVERLLQEATSHENLCQCYVGWCPFW
ncbi:unnamed protein product [Polarella glacialis]|uniref:FATC domain-containing protein n=1 Tax=Polarella glacialis TaxID=89957 RepID=A0A813IGE9_POLGL|nr:unnamed protein product [Polarella glacialis]